jgi:hypothetical protein
MNFRDYIGTRYRVTAAWAQQKIDHYVGDAYEYADVDQYSWRYDPAFPVNRVTAEDSRLKTRDQWLDWYRDELGGAEQNEERSPEYYRGLEHVYLADPAAMPVILKRQGPQGVLQDGHHRFAIALHNKLTTLPAIVGTPKQE